MLFILGLQSGVQALIVISLVIVLCVIVYAVLFQVQKHIMTEPIKLIKCLGLQKNL